MRLSPVLALAAAALLTVPALAHHGFTGRYDTTAPIYLEGEVAEAVFGFPHAVLDIAVTDGAAVPAALTETFGPGLAPVAQGGILSVELPPVALFNTLEARIAVGDQIALVVLRNCDPPHQLRAQWVAPAEGDPVLRDRILQEEVVGC